MLLVSAGLFLSSFLLITQGFIGTEFLNTGDRGEFIVQLELPKDATLPETNRLTRQAENYILQLPEVDGLFTTVGTQSGIVIGRQSPNIAEITIKLIDKRFRDLPTSIFALQVKKCP